MAPNIQQLHCSTQLHHLSIAKLSSQLTTSQIANSQAFSNRSAVLLLQPPLLSAQEIHHHVPAAAGCTEFG
jgi:hypothetical protein